MKEVIALKKALVFTLALIIAVTGIFAACSKESNNEETSAEGLQDNAAEVEITAVPVTDEDGNEVTDENGEIVTEMVMVTSNDVNGSSNKKDSSSLGNDSSETTDNSGNNKNEDEDNDETLATNPTENITVTTKKGVASTAPEKESSNDDKNDSENNSSSGSSGSNNSSNSGDNTTSQDSGKEDEETENTEDNSQSNNNQNDVPHSSDTGVEVNFSEKDQLIVKSMLEVPYLYQASYENDDGVPIEIATHVAVWMAEHQGGTSKVYPSSSVVLNLFKYFGQTVVGFKSKCNDYVETSKAPIKYNSKVDTFTITEFTSKKQTVNITKIEALDKENYYKVTASVSGCSKDKVVAIIQKNKLESSLGFSIKALKWS